MFLKQIFPVFILSYGIVFLLTPLFIRFARKHKILDMPDNRKVHKQPIPTLGGVVIYLAFNLTLLLALRLSGDFWLSVKEYILALFIGGFLISILGLLHDTVNITVRDKILGQIIVALILFNAGVKIDFITNPFGGVIILPLALSMLVSVGWIMVIVNAINLIDGLDGLAAGVTIISSLSLLAIALLKNDIGTVFIIIALIGSLSGFLRYNFHPAKIFMGDCGSMFLGFILSIISIQGINKMAATVSLLVPITALGVPIYDVVFAVLRRSIKGGGIFQPDRKHIHYRLLEIGMTHEHVVMALYFMGIYFGIISYLFVLLPTKYELALLLLLAMGVFTGLQAIAFLEHRLKFIFRMKSKG